MEYTEEEKRELERQELEFKRKQSDDLIRKANEQGCVYGWQLHEPNTTDEWRQLAVQLSETRAKDVEQANARVKEIEKEVAVALDGLRIELNGFARALSYLLSNSVCGEMTHRARKKMAGHALYAVKCMKNEFASKILEVQNIYSTGLPF